MTWVSKTTRAAGLVGIPRAVFMNYLEGSPFAKDCYQKSWEDGNHSGTSHHHRKLVSGDHANDKEKHSEKSPWFNR